MLVVMALGGNALLRRDEPMDVGTQRRNVAVAARAVAAVALDHNVVVTHGNGPQVGLLALQSESYHAVSPYPLDVLNAESEGMIGYLLEQALENELPGREIANLLTEVIVRSDDPAFAAPTKPVGPQYVEAEARRLAAERGWMVAPDGKGFRRMVPSPEPRSIVQLKTIKTLIDAGVLVICVGGGGIPITENESGVRKGAEAVIDKDLAAALLAKQIDADLLMLLTDVENVEMDWGTPEARPIRSITVEALRQTSFVAGSMGPKVEAACRFVEATGKRAAIGSLSQAPELLRGDCGTQVWHSARPSA
jgi:carbamate kinase